MTITGHIVDIEARSIYKGKILIEDGKIKSISPAENVEDQFILPGFIDAHVHVESSMLVPSEFARLSVVHGTVATISDPHEIGNVLGINGVHYMIGNGKTVPFHFYFGAPSCVPATSFETAGAEINTDDIESLMRLPEIKYLAEMMNWPGVLQHDPVVMTKIAAAKKYGKRVDGHAPGLRGDQARAYAAAGIETDHECFTSEEALDKLANGMKILIREGSAARNFDALIGLLPQHYQNIMFCSDDKHPDSLEEGHINLLVKRAIAKGMDVFHVLQAACINPIVHYSLEVGRLRPNDSADFIVVDNLSDFNVLKTFVSGTQVAERGETQITRQPVSIINNFRDSVKTEKDFRVPALSDQMNVIVVQDGQLVTTTQTVKSKVVNGNAVSNLGNDVLKIAVVNRYADSLPAIGFVKNFGLKLGAIASSVAHDSHNIVVVGVDDQSMAAVVNMIMDAKGGVAAIADHEKLLLPLPVAGIMSADDGYKVAQEYKLIDGMAKKMGSTLNAPFMTLSFMALLVIPSLKLSDRGLFDGDRFAFTDLFIK